MKDKYFLDTNIFVYSFEPSEPTKNAIARDLIQNALKEQIGCISSQVIQEFLNVSTKKFNPPLAPQDSLKYLNTVLAPLCEISTSVELYRKTIETSERWKYSFYDSLILAAAIQTNCSILYSEDLQHGQNIQSLTILNPFLSS
ncbi:PIN domain-containing protein [Candidatus Thiosymbion oneisti]|uniref:PIN domain-containing protein n=1 Tax=Candidatus Thiosymbion oneisti TaxID=589554 RepID=UPI000B7EDCA9|nr:PIN domain-containing protein [Candidatus Thiosymbion oneisti]